MKKQNVLIGVCAGIAAYKTCELARMLVKSGYSVKVMMTDSAVRFIAPLTFQTLCSNQVYTEMFSLLNEDNVQHISLAQWADVCLIAPATANTISKIAYGFCDNLLTTVVCALPKNTPVIFAPAMNSEMWNNPIIQENIKKLKSFKKYQIIEPGKGELACGAYGDGRMAEPEDIFKMFKGK